MSKETDKSDEWNLIWAWTQKAEGRSLTGLSETTGLSKAYLSDLDRIAWRSPSLKAAVLIEEATGIPTKRWDERRRAHEAREASADEDDKAA